MTHPFFNVLNVQAIHKKCSIFYPSFFTQFYLKFTYGKLKSPKNNKALTFDLTWTGDVGLHKERPET